MILKPLEDVELEAHLDAIAADALDSYLLGDGEVRLSLVHGTTLANRLRANHELGPVGARILANTAMIALLATSTLKQDERVSIIVDVDGPIRGFSAEATAAGTVRGYIREPAFLGEVDGDISSAFGAGTLTVMRVFSGAPNPMQGQIEWRGSDIVRNVARYYAESEQTVTLLDASTALDDSYRITGAAALLAQPLPGADSALLDEIAVALRELPPLGRAFAQGETTASFVHRYLAPFGPRATATRAAEFFCSCSHQRFGQFLASLPEEEKSGILRNGPHPLVTTCHNCNSSYEYPLEELTALLG